MMKNRLDDKLNVMRFVRDPNKKGRIQVEGSTSWADIIDGHTMRGDDLRVPLYSGPPSSPYVHTLIFDFDNLDWDHGEGLLDVLEATFSSLCLLVHTGNGFHAYLPLVQSYTHGEIPMLKASYVMLCDELRRALEDKLPHTAQFKVDPGPFNMGAYGRMPGSSNTKKLDSQVSLYAWLEGDVLDRVEDLLVHKAVEPRRHADHRSPVAEGEGALKDSVFYKHCRFLRWVHTDVNEVDYSSWKHAMILTSNLGRRDWADEINKDYQGDSAHAVDAFFEKAGSYPSYCRTISRSAMRESGWHGCMGCSHNYSHNTPVNITGPAPTPSKSDGYHKTDSEGDVVETRINTNDVASEWSNRHSHASVVDGELWDYNPEEGVYDRRADSIKDFATYDTPLRKELAAIPNHGIYESDDKKKLAQALSTSTYMHLRDTEEFDWAGHVAFNNGLLNVETGAIEAFDPEKRVTSKAVYDYDENLDFSFVHDFFEDMTLCPEAVRLLQAFAGLMLSNIPNKSYQQFIWLSGAPVSGKSTLVELMDTVTGDKAISYPSTGSFAIAEDSYKLDFFGRKIFYIDDLKLPMGKERQFIAFMNPLVSGAAVNVKIPFKPIRKLAPKTTVAVTSNDFPPRQLAKEGFDRRLRVANFSVAMTREHKRMLAAFYAEPAKMGAVMCWAVQGLKGCLERARETAEYLPGHTPFETALKSGGLGAQDSPIETFFNEALVIGQAGDSAPVAKLETLHRAWARERDRRPLPRHKLVQTVGMWVSEQTRLAYEQIITPDAVRHVRLNERTRDADEDAQNARTRGRRDRDRSKGVARRDRGVAGPRRLRRTKT